MRKNRGLFDSTCIIALGTHWPARLIFFFSFCTPPCVLHAQWPTSTLTDSALVINYGFTARVVTFDDGSSIFCDGLANTVYLTKLDTRGYKVWPGGFIIAHANDSSNFGGGGDIISDGAGGAIVGWQDNRGALYDTTLGVYLNCAYYVQHVDAAGIVRWQQRGVEALSPSGGRNGGRIVTDGSGGIIYAGAQVGFGYPGAPNRSRLVALRVNREGQKLWERTLDSSYSENLPIYLSSLERAGRYIYIDYYKYIPPQIDIDLTMIVDTTGALAPNPIWMGYHENVSWRDSILFSRVGNQISKIGSSGDTLWSTAFPLPQESCRWLSVWKSILPETRGGLIDLRVCNDSMFYVNAAGQAQRMRIAGLSSITLHPNTIGVFGDGHGGFVWADEAGIAQRYDSVGTPLWGMSPNVYRSDPQNAYAPQYWGDNNGGIIASMWTTTRGLCVQHTGRYGRPGVVPVIDERNLPTAYALYQNYPNPFNPKTEIVFSLTKRDKVRLIVYDILGREITTLVDEVRPAGRHVVPWTAVGMSSGVYFYRFTAGSYTCTKKLVVLK
jgi:hypothetical protein